MNKYRVFYNEDHIFSSIEQYRRQRRVYPWFIAVKVACALGLAALLAIIIYGVVTSIGKTGPLVLIAGVPVFFLLLLVLGSRIDNFFLKRRLKKSPFYGDEIIIDISDSGVAVSTPRSQAALQWSVFTTARRLGAGFLVFTGPTAFDWWPDAALAGGTLNEVERLLRANIADYESKAA